MTRRVVLDGALVVRNVEAMRQAILDGFQEADTLSLDIAAEHSVDLCGVQLIESARRFARTVGKAVVLERPAAAFAAVLEGAGFLTDASPEDRQFWLHEEHQQ
jgi:anti-anti-sigma regulatory factor